jgi:uracil-DNA glycosylase
MVIVSETYVPDEGPFEAPIVFIGEAPGTTEREERRPFVGASGQKLEHTLLRNGIERSAVRLCNLVHYQPQGNKFEIFEGGKDAPDSPYLTKGLEELAKYFKERKTKPTIVVLLGSKPLKYVGRIKRGGVSVWRGSLFNTTFPGLEGVKIVSTYHPSAVLRDASIYPVFDLDLRRVFDESKFPELNLPTREFVIIDKDPMKLEEAYEQIKKYDKIAIDIETFGPKLACLGVAGEAGKGYCIIWDGSGHTQEVIEKILRSDQKKIIQNALFEINYLSQFSWTINNVWWDTMIAMHVMFPEFPRSLAFMASVFTREPHYKYEGKASEDDSKSWSDTMNKESLWIYNIKDCCVTFEVQEALEKFMSAGPGNWKKLFDHEMSLIPCAHKLSTNGMRIDREKQAEFSKLVDEKIAEATGLLDSLSGGFVSGTRKKKQKTAITVTQVSHLLYKRLELPIRRKAGKKNVVTTEEDALVSLLGVCAAKIDELRTPENRMKWEIKQTAIRLILMIRGWEKLKSSYLSIEISSDDRVRSFYKIAATVTGRLASSKWVDGTGLNAMTFPRGHV